LLLRKAPVLVSYQYAASAMCPAGRIAERSFIAIPITFGEVQPARFISSPIVLTRRRRGDEPVPDAGPRIRA
jgi:hypothetical protein